LPQNKSVFFYIFKCFVDDAVLFRTSHNFFNFHSTKIFLMKNWEPSLFILFVDVFFKSGKIYYFGP